MKFEHLNRYIFVDKESMVSFIAELVYDGVSFNVASSANCIFQTFGMSDKNKGILENLINRGTVKIQDNFGSSPKG